MTAPGQGQLRDGQRARRQGLEWTRTAQVGLRRRWGFEAVLSSLPTAAVAMVTASCRCTPRRGHPLTERLRHTQGMASQPSSSDRFSVAELTVHSAQSDLLEVEPLDLGPDAPATAALNVERGPQPRDMRQRGE